jgi:hypothetical protein
MRCEQLFQSYNPVFAVLNMESIRFSSEGYQVMKQIGGNVWRVSLITYAGSC